jgi:aminomethyltransferase
MNGMLAKTPLHDWHAAHQARLVDFAGWSMPVQYSSIVAEHNATRQAVGIFDVSHMGRIRFSATSGLALLYRILTRDVRDIKSGQVRYSLVTRDDGGILDDVLIYHVVDGRGRPYYELVVNAGNRLKILDWLEAHRGDADFVDRTLETAMIAVQGPRAIEIVRQLSPLDPARLRYYACAETEIAGKRVLISRTGYTGEDGCELIVPAAMALQTWERLIVGASALGGMAAGLGARDTLRLEAGMPLYGHELTEDIDPFEAGLPYAVDLKDRAFPGHDALVARGNDTKRPRRAGWLLEGKRVPREGYAVHREGSPVGRVTSGTFSPTLGKPIAMGYVPRELARPGTDVSIDIRGSLVPAQCVSLPFYRRNS